MAIYRPRLETFNDYDSFVEKFKPKKTTDDCYTPPQIYEAVKNYVVDTYGLAGREIVRPFYPGGDYESFDYPAGGVVIDNPPFSIISQICKDYAKWGIDFFLFAPHLTNFNIPANHVICGINIEYENGAKVATSFVTSFGDHKAETAPELYRILVIIQKSEFVKKLPKYKYPAELLTVNDMEKLCRAGIHFGVQRYVKVRRLDAQIKLKKSIYGAGLLIDHEKAKQKIEKLKWIEDKAINRETIEWKLSEREQQIIDDLK